ncbi:glycosyl hydrolase 108 family protein [Mesorhizobium sp. RSR380A]|uniref:glycosyl hydrolase 108 family protein n=1 Tax=Mesorhizobium sp. LNJC380A00 TaxID=1287264 RepID=UPI0012EBF9C7|nr:glycosyl hydrolase 108 family protein [Mesorhizobium sp. LNJC380A00]
MAISREKKAPAKVLTRGGGYSDNKKDPGGPTMKGVHGGRSARRNRDPARH